MSHLLAYRIAPAGGVLQLEGDVLDELRRVGRADLGADVVETLRHLQ